MIVPKPTQTTHPDKVANGDAEANGQRHFVSIVMTLGVSGRKHGEHQQKRQHGLNPKSLVTSQSVGWHGSSQCPSLVRWSEAVKHGGSSDSWGWTRWWHRGCCSLWHFSYNKTNDSNSQNAWGTGELRTAQATAVFLSRVAPISRSLGRANLKVDVMSYKMVKIPIEKNTPSWVHKELSLGNVLGLRYHWFSFVSCLLIAGWSAQNASNGAMAPCMTMLTRRRKRQAQNWNNMKCSVDGN